MSQQRITLFFPLVWRKKNSPPVESRSRFLELPYNIRRRIYFEAGLLTGKTIHMNFWATRMRTGLDREPRDYDENSSLPSLPLSLIAVCRAVDEEITQIFYGENCFAIMRRAPRGLRALERVRDSTLRKMRFVVVRLNLASCANLCCGHQDRKCGNAFYDSGFHPSHDEPLDQARMPGQSIISQWQRICTRLSVIEPGKLAFYLVCDCADHQTADMIVQPFLTLPTLRDSALRLARDYEPQLQSLARNAVLRVTGGHPPQALPPFRFLNLPKEIQLSILRYTSLVNDYEITCRQDRMHCLGSCFASGAATEGPRFDIRLFKCFCSKGHSAFNFRCDGCASLGFPHAMFLVSREFRDAAIEVFYGKNEFEVSMTRSIPSSAELARDAGHMSIVHGLQRFPRYSLQFLTRLIFLFEEYELGSLQLNQTAWASWTGLVNALSKEATIPILGLEIRFTEPSYNSIWDPPLVVDDGHDERMLRTYRRMIEPVVALKGLKNFFVHMNWNSSCGVPGKGVPDRRQIVEQKFERMIMGQQYDAWKCGKAVRMDMDMYVY
ncbi:hypothetical protein B0O99DRAFT_611648 [Bisporella sp. PMI_857]|nr:hypothetical protein B0O99DRAFT_611648 [Bisporella sp. PMI_857]